MKKQSVLLFLMLIVISGWLISLNCGSEEGTKDIEGTQSAISIEYMQQVQETSAETFQELCVRLDNLASQEHLSETLHDSILTIKELGNSLLLDFTKLIQDEDGIVVFPEICEQHHLQTVQQLKAELSLVQEGLKQEVLEDPNYTELFTLFFTWIDDTSGAIMNGSGNGKKK